MPIINFFSVFLSALWCPFNSASAHIFVILAYKLKLTLELNLKTVS